MATAKLSSIPLMFVKILESSKQIAARRFPPLSTSRQCRCSVVGRRFRRLQDIPMVQGRNPLLRLCNVHWRLFVLVGVLLDRRFWRSHLDRDDGFAGEGTPIQMGCRCRGQLAACRRIVLRDHSPLKQTMRLDVSHAEVIGNLHPRQLPRTGLIADLTDLAARQFERQRIRFLALAQRCRAQHRTGLRRDF